MGSRKGLLSEEDRRYLDGKVSQNPRMVDRSYKNHYIPNLTNINRQANRELPKVNTIITKKSNSANIHRQNEKTRRRPG